MNYAQVLDFLFSKLPMYQRIGSAAYKEDINNTLALCELLGNPEKKIKSVHIAGTNGKGSVSHFIASIFQEAGYKTGLYTSPHLKDFRERIKINGEMVPKDYVSSFTIKYKDSFSNLNLSFFEMTVGLAFQYFAEQKVDIAIIETGLGGRLDSTNVIIPEASVITNIDFDHTALLGKTLEKIAFEKAGIIKKKKPVIIGQTQKTIKKVFTDKAEHEEAPIYFADDTYTCTCFIQSESNKNLSEITISENGTTKKKVYLTPLSGQYQKHNIITALKTIDILKTENWDIKEEHIYKGIQNVKNNTDFKGRWHILSEKPLVICDTAHNPAGIKEVFSQIKNLKYKKLHIVLGMVNDKDASNILGLFPESADYYFCKPNIPRGLEASTLFEKAQAFNMKGQVHNSVSEAYNIAMKSAMPDDLIFVGGSTFVVAEII